MFDRVVACVRIQLGLKDYFDITINLFYESALSSYLLILIVDELMKHIYDELMKHLYLLISIMSEVMACDGFDYVVLQ
jgi:hypothetical protein